MSMFFKSKNVKTEPMYPDGDSRHSSPNNSLNNGRATRQQEKEQLSGLNDRLAKYIQLVRNLETENARLHVKVNESEVVIRRERESLINQYEKKITELRHEVDTLNYEVNKVQMEHVKKIEDRYQNKLQDQLSQMRADFDARIAQNRAEIDNLYRNKLAAASETAKRNLDLASEARGEADRYRLKVKQLETSLSENNANISDLNARINSLESQLREEKEMSEIRVAKRDDRIRALENEVAQMISEYQDLMDIKVQLDTELLAYQKLLEGEEDRLNIDQPRGQDDSCPGVIQPTIRRAIKRRRFDRMNLFETKKEFILDESSNGPVKIDEIDEDGKYIKVLNTRNTQASIGGWTIICTGGNMEVMYKFSSNQTISPNGAIYVWSKNVEEAHRKGVHLIMKNQAWPIAENVRCELFDTNKQLVSWKQIIEKDDEPQ